MRCYRCMKEFDREYEVCPHCGYINSACVTEPFQLPPGTMLQDRYWIGMMIGFGGFGITYKAFDTKLNVTVAIKEYYPAGLASRESGTTRVQRKHAHRESAFEEGLTHFIEEARNIARFSDHPNIVKVYHFFRENHTGYIVMEYLDGITMRYFLEVNGGKTSVLYAKEIVLAVAQALQVLHREGILHRDISPDNIFLCSDGKIKLIDFGSSKWAETRKDGWEIVVKPGYAPPEQYEKDGKQGPWTDIYALGATFYRAVTGVALPESVGRRQQDLLVRPRECNKEVPEYIEAAILKAMAVESKDRFQKVDDLIDVLLKHKVVPVPQTEKEKKKRRQVLLLSVLSVFVLVLLVGLLAKWVSIREKGYLAEELTLWVCAKDGEDTAAVEAYYQKISDELFADGEDVSVHVHAEAADVYEDRLREAFSDGNAPDLFDSTTLMADGDLMQHAAGLKDCFRVLKEAVGSDFLSAYGEDLANETRVPVGFDLPVVYTLQQADTEGEQPLLPDFDDTNTYDGSSEDEKLLEQFAAGEIRFLCGDMTDYARIRDAVYGTYEEPKDQVDQLLRVRPLADEGGQVSFTTTFSVNQDGTAGRQRTAALYLMKLLSYKGQALLHRGQDDILECHALSLVGDVDREYHGYANEVLSIWEDRQ